MCIHNTELIDKDSIFYWLVIIAGKHGQASEYRRFLHIWNEKGIFQAQKQAGKKLHRASEIPNFWEER